ncbi:MAG: hypothetical protein FJ295_08200 [Planctomycetes bacterium]|nr:hypothetical protein [Planctomycetota bacterium]
MRRSPQPNPRDPGPHDEVDQLLLNAQLRDELEPYRDEAVDLVNISRMSTPMENEFLASMLEWERAPTLPISQWFEPELTMPRPETLDDPQLHRVLWDTIHKLYSRRVALELTDHLSDRQLYCLIYRDILPSHEKKINRPRHYLHWHCIDDVEDRETWLRYYASDEERTKWAEETGALLPIAESPPFPRRMPSRPK